MADYVGFGRVASIKIVPPPPPPPTTTTTTTTTATATATATAATISFTFRTNHQVPDQNKPDEKWNCFWEKDTSIPPNYIDPQLRKESDEISADAALLPLLTQAYDRDAEIELDITTTNVTIQQNTSGGTTTIDKIITITTNTVAGIPIPTSYQLKSITVKA